MSVRLTPEPPKNYTLLFTALFTITSLVFFYAAMKAEAAHPFDSDTYESITWWFATGTVVLWATFAVVALISVVRKRRS